MDLAKYRALFLEEATECLAEMSRALLELEKDPAAAAALDAVFRAAHSIKGMASSLGYDSITELAHRLEDRMGAHRNRGRLEESEAPSLLFRALDGLERMVEAVRATGEPPAPDPELVAALRAGAPLAEPTRKKAPLRT